MTANEINKNFTNTVKIWNGAIDSYSDELFAKKPADDQWSVGQVCQHLISSTNRAFGVVERCLSGNENSNEQKTETGEEAMRRNELADVQIKLPLSVQATPEQPANKEIVKHAFAEMADKFAEFSKKVDQSTNKGKEKHPVLGFMNSKEWLQTIEMHFRHHLRQKQRIDAVLQRGQDI